MICQHRFAPLFYVLVSGCVFTPTDDTRVSSASRPVWVSGYTTRATASIRVEAAPSRSGPFVEVSTIMGNAVPIPLRAGTVYSYGANVRIPTSFWSIEGCERATYVRAVDPATNFKYFTFERVAPDGRPPQTCVNLEQDRTGDLLGAARTCASAQSPIVRLTAPGPDTRHFGNLTLRRPADATPYQCVEVVYGDLIVREETITGPPGALPPIRLPRLREVRGRLDLVYQQPAHLGFREARRIDLPELARVRGDVIFTNPRPAARSDLSQVIMGMPRLSRVGGDVSLSSSVTGSSWSGLDNLVSIPGNFSADLRGDWNIRGFGRLSNVSGDVQLRLADNGAGLRTLRTVGGDFVQEGGNHTSSSSFRNLARVNGNMTLRRTHAIPGNSIFGNLGYVGGRLTIDASAVDGSAFNIGPATGPFVGGGLTVQNNPSPTSVGLGVRMSGSASAVFTSNPALCTSTINAWLDAQTSWTGARSLSGNGGC